jgi:mannose/fructose/N-acetylgalactosamine-specific phosphotransferase system component IIB
MFNKFIEALKTFFSAKPVSLQFEEMLLQEAVQKIKDEDAAREKVAAVEAKVADVAVKVEAVMAVAEAKTPAVKKTPAKKAATKKTTKKPNIKIAK